MRSCRDIIPDHEEISLLELLGPLLKESPHSAYIVAEDDVSKAEVLHGTEHSFWAKSNTR